MTLKITLAAAAAGLAIAVAADAQSVTVFGDSNAEACYRAAEARDVASSAIAGCNQALSFERLTLRDRAATHINRGIVHVARENYQAAVDDYAAAVALRPEQPESYVNRGNVYFLAERFPEAIAEYDEALRRGIRQEHIARLNRGMAHEHIGDRSTAEAEYRAALAIRPNWNLAEEKLARLMASTG